MTVRSIEGLAWRWQMIAGRCTLVTDGGGMMVILAGENGSKVVTRDPETGVLRPIVEADEVARILESAPMVRKHAKILLDGIDLGLVTIDTAADPVVETVINDLRRALKGGD